MRGCFNYKALGGGEGWEAEELTQRSRDASRAAEDELSCSAAACRPPNILQEPGGEYELFITRQPGMA